MNECNLLNLLHLTDPALPIGGFSHSGGLEAAVQQGHVNNRQTTFHFIKAQLQYNLQPTDAVLATLSFRAMGSINFNELVRFDQLCHAVKLPREMREASQKMGSRLLRLFMHDALNVLPHKHYSVIFGALAAVLDIDEASMLHGFFYNQLVALVTNSVKLVPLSQYAGQELVHELKAWIPKLVALSQQADESRIGACCPGFDLYCMEHEQLYSRLYMS